MALGRELGVFEMKSTSITLKPGKKKAVTAEVNFEGTLSGEIDCVAVATMRVESADGKDGKYSIVSRCLLADGEILDATGSGKTTHTGDHKWLVAGVATMSDDRSFAVQGEIDFPTRRFTGKLYARI